MALDQTTKDTILSRFQGGEKLPVIFQDLNIEMSDRIVWRQEYRQQIIEYRNANTTPAQTDEERLAAMTVEQLDNAIARINSRIAFMNNRLTMVQAEKNSR